LIDWHYLLTISTVKQYRFLMLTRTIPIELMKY